MVKFTIADKKGPSSFENRHYKCLLALSDDHSTICRMTPKGGISFLGNIVAKLCILQAPFRAGQFVICKMARAWSYSLAW